MKTAKKIICLLQVLLLVWMPLYAHADGFDDKQAEGRQYGGTLIPDPTDLFGTNATGDGFNLFPDSANELSIDSTELFPGQTGYDPQGAKDAFGSDTDIINLGDEAATDLGTENSSTGEAWRTVIDSRNVAHPDLRNDPIWGQTDKTLAESFSGEFDHCETTTSTRTVEQTLHYADKKTCQRLIKPTGACEVAHNYSATWELESGEPENYCTPGAATGSHTSPFTGGSIGEPALDLSLSCPHEEDDEIVVNYQFMHLCGMNHQTNSYSATIKIDDNGVPSVGTPATIDIWDQATESIKDSSNLLGADYDQRGCYLELRGGICNNTTCNLNFRFYDAYNYGGSASSDFGDTFTVSMKPPGSYIKNVVDEWSPTSCIDAALANVDSFCEGSVVCADSPGTGPCIDVNGVDVCENDLGPSPIPGIDPLCRKVDVSNDNCDFNVGPMDCWVDANGQTQCPSNEGGNDNTCTVYEDDPSCGYIKSECIEGLTGASNGACYGWEDTYDCGHDITKETEVTENYINCDGDTRCVENGGPGETGAVDYNVQQIGQPTIEHCTRGYIDPGTQFTVTHPYKVDLITLLGGDGAISHCGTGCLNIWVGRIGDNYWHGSCRIYEQATNLYITNTDVVTSATLDRVVYDDYMQIYMDNNMVWTGPNGNFPPETAGRCELSTSRNYPINVDVTNYFHEAGPLDLKTRVSVTGGGEGYSHITAHFDPSKVIQNDNWFMTNRLKTALAADMDGCTANIRCVDDPIPDGQLCGTYHGYQVCKNYFGTMPEGLETISPSCRKALVTYTCEDNNTDGLDTCNNMDEDCSYISEECVDGFKDPETGICFLADRTVSCAPSVPAAPTTGALVCGVRGMGTGDVNREELVSTDFSKAVGLLNIAQYMAQDMDCGVESSGTDCAIFEGVPMECKVALGGWSDCCESPGGTSLSDYIKLLQAGNKAASAQQWLGVIDNPIAGYWNGAKSLATDGYSAVEDAAVDAFSTVTDGFTQAWGSLVGNATPVATESIGTEATTQATETIIGGVIDTLVKNTAQWVMNTFGETAVDFIFSGTTESGVAVAASDALTTEGSTVSLGGTVGAVLGPIMMVYMIYCIANILVHIIWKCEDEEFEFAMKKDLKVCHSLGSYCASKALGSCVEVRKAGCCFNSPMSRILQEQIRPQLGMSWGTAEDPDCSGIPINRMDEIDWSAVNLDEWLAILAVTGNDPQLSPELLDMDHLTGAQNSLNDAMPDEQRSNVFDRTQDRFEGYDPQDANENMSQGLYGY